MALPAEVSSSRKDLFPHVNMPNGRVIQFYHEEKESQSDKHAFKRIVRS